MKGISHFQHKIYNKIMEIKGSNYLQDKGNKVRSPFWVLVEKEITAAIHSWKFIILTTLISLIFIASIYVSLESIQKIRDLVGDEKFHLYLRLFTASELSLPPFYIFLSFLSPLLGITLGFDAINSERSGGTLINLLSQPIYRDNVLLSKFLAPIILIAILFFSITFLLIGVVMLLTGLAISPAEFIRIFLFVILTVLYVSFWLGFGILSSIIFQQPSTSALLCIGGWLFLIIFYPFFINLFISTFYKGLMSIDEKEFMEVTHNILTLQRLSPSQLYNDATATLLTPTIRSLGPLSLEQTYGAIPSELSIENSISIVFPQITALIAASISFFAFCYFRFMRQEIKG